VTEEGDLKFGHGWPASIIGWENCRSEDEAAMTLAAIPAKMASASRRDPCRLERSAPNWLIEQGQLLLGRSQTEGHNALIVGCQRADERPPLQVLCVLHECDEGQSGLSWFLSGRKMPDRHWRAG
jgi:hypothetical protein